MEYLEKFGFAFIPLFVAIDPIGLAALYLGLSQGVAEDRRRRISRQAVLTAGVVAIAFLILGRSIFIALNITVNDFQIAGGLILFVLAARDLIDPEQTHSPVLSDDFGVVPLGMPLIAGPATLTTLLIAVEAAGFLLTFVALALNLGLVALAFAYSGRLGRIMGKTGLRATSKIISLLLAAIAISMIRRGVMN